MSKTAKVVAFIKVGTLRNTTQIGLFVFVVTSPTEAEATLVTVVVKDISVTFPKYQCK